MDTIELSAYNVSMLKLLLRVLAITAAIMFTVAYIPGITIAGGWQTLALVALLWAALATVIKPILKILTLPISLFTFGLSSVIINAVLFWSMTLIIPGFAIAGIIPIVLGSVLLSICTWVITSIV
jgi:putative membrane protein